LQVFDALVVPEKVDAILRKTRLERYVQFAGGDHIETETFFGYDAQELRRRKSLRRVQDLSRVTHRGDVFGRSLAHGRLVIDIERRAVLVCKLDQVAAAHF